MIEPIVAIVGNSKFEKTKLIEELVDHLNRSGLSVSVIKDTHHDLELDRNGKDTCKIKNAGSATITNNKKLANLSYLKNTVSPMELAKNFLRSGCDFVLLDDFMQDDIPKIEICNDQFETSLTFKGMEDVVAIVTDFFVNEDEIDIPVFSKDDIPGIAEFLELEFMICPSKVS